jgi:hypothetical protein
VHIVPNYLADTSTNTVPSTDNEVDNDHLESNEDFLDYGKKLTKKKKLSLSKDKPLITS